jgi:hypothetical protein
VEQEESQWKEVKSLDEVRTLIDHCILLRWSHMLSLKRHFDQTAHAEIMGYFVARLASAEKNRLITVVTVESVLIWLASVDSEELEEAFLRRLLESVDLCQEFLFAAQSMEFIDQEHGEKLYAAAVVIIGKLGVELWQRTHEQEGKLPPLKKVKVDALLSSVASHLLSVSNQENIAIRLSLLQYFGFMAHREEERYRKSFNRIVARYGFTLMEHLFMLMGNSKCSNIALHYLIEIGSYILEADRKSQQILHQVLKSFMLKEPERFLVLVEALTAHLSELGPQGASSRNLFLQHTAMLVQVIAETNHKSLTNNLLFILATYYEEASYRSLLDQLQEKPSLKAKIKGYLKELTAISGPAQLLRIEGTLRMKKRGRRPQQGLHPYKNPLSQVSFLGKCELTTAS